MQLPLYLVTDVIDEGMGISKEHMEFLFQPFSELRATQDITKNRDHGIGLGLSCSKTISKVLEGDVLILYSHLRSTTQDQKGTCVRFYVRVKIEDDIEDDVPEESINSAGDINLKMDKKSNLDSS